MQPSRHTRLLYTHPVPLKDDLIQQTLKQLAATLQALSGPSDPQVLEKAEISLKDAYRKHTGTEAALFRQLPSDQLLGVLSSAGVLDREKAYLIATLFQTEVALQEKVGEGSAAKNSSVGLQLKALDLYLEAALAELDVDDLNDKIADSSAELSGFVLPEATEWRLFEFAVMRGDYAGAEDRLFRLLNDLGPTPAVTQRGQRFYSRLRTLPDEKLAVGDLPRAEVEEGQATFDRAISSAA